MSWTPGGWWHEAGGPVNHFGRCGRVRARRGLLRQRAGQAHGSGGELVPPRDHGAAGVGCALAVSAQVAARRPASRDPAGVVQVRPAGLFTPTGAGRVPAAREQVLSMPPSLRFARVPRAQPRRTITGLPDPAAGGLCTLATAAADHARRDQRETTPTAPGHRPSGAPRRRRSSGTRRCLLVSAAALSDRKSLTFPSCQ